MFVFYIYILIPALSHCYAAGVTKPRVGSKCLLEKSKFNPKSSHTVLHKSLLVSHQFSYKAIYSYIDGYKIILSPSVQVFPSHFTQQRCKDLQSSSSSSELDSRLCSSSASTAVGGCRSGGGSQTNISCTANTPSSTHNSLSSCTGTPQSLGISTDFWDLLVKLDNMNVSRKGKASMKTVPLGAPGEAEGAQLSLEASPLGQLMNMLSHPVIRRSSLLTEKLLRLLSLISIALPDNKATEVPAGHPVPQVPSAVSAAPSAQAAAGSVGTAANQGATAGTVPASQPASTASAVTTTIAAATGTPAGTRAIEEKVV